MVAGQTDRQIMFVGATAIQILKMYGSLANHFVYIKHTYDSFDMFMQKTTKFAIEHNVIFCTFALFCSDIINQKLKQAKKESCKFALLVNY